MQRDFCHGVCRIGLGFPARRWQSSSGRRATAPTGSNVSTIRLSRDVLDHFRARGRSRQTPGSTKRCATVIKRHAQPERQRGVEAGTSVAVLEECGAPWRSRTPKPWFRPERASPVPEECGAPWRSRTPKPWFRPEQASPVLEECGAPWRSRTPNLWIRSPTLYPVELRVHGQPRLRAHGTLAPCGACRDPWGFSVHPTPPSRCRGLLSPRR